MALRFTGNTSAATNYIRVINPASKLSPQLPMSFGAWVRRQDDLGGNEFIIHSGDFSAEVFGLELTHFNVNSAEFWMDGVGTEATSTAVVVADGWVHLMVAIDESGNYTMYRNGVPDGTGTGVTAATGHDNDVFLGVFNSSSNNPSTGDDVEACEWFVYSRELSAIEAARIAAGYEPPAAGRLMYVSGEDASGHDADGNTVTVAGSPEVIAHPPQIKRKNRVNLLSQARSQHHLQLVEEQDRSTEVLWVPSSRPVPYRR